MQEKELKSTNKPRYRWLRRFARTMLGILIFLILLLLFIRSPWGQSIIIGQVIDYVKGKTGTEIQLDRAFITFDGNIQVDGLYMGDVNNDTLVYSRSLEADMALWPLINGTGIDLDYLKWNGLTARVVRKDSIEGFNYQFLTDAFATAPDTTASQPLNLNIGNIVLTNFDVIYKDQVGEMDATAIFDELILEMNELDLERMVVDIENLSLKNAIINYEQDVVTSFAKSETDDFPEQDTNLAEAITDDANDSPLPLLSARNLQLTNVELNYNSKPEAIVLQTHFGVLESSIPKADVQNSQYVVDGVKLQDSHIELSMIEIADSSLQSNNEPIAIEWPDLNVSLNQLNFKNNSFLYSLNGAQPSTTQLSPDAISLTDINVDLRNFNLADKSARVVLDNTSLKEYSGLTVNQLSGEINVTDNDLIIKDLIARVNNSSIDGSIGLAYNGIDQLINNPESLKVNATIPSYIFDLKDLYSFQPDLSRNEYVKQLSKQPLTGRLTATGSTGNLKIDRFTLNWGRNSVTANGTLTQVTDVDQLTFNLPNIKVVTDRNSLLPFINEKDLGITLPQKAQLTANVSGNVNNVQGKANLMTSYGSMIIDGDFKNGEKIKFDSKLFLEELELSKMLSMPELGNLSLQLQTSGNGSNVNDLDASIEGTITSFAYNDYPLTNIPIKGSMNNGAGIITSKFKDDNINIALDANLKLNQNANDVNAIIDIAGIDLRAFGITSQNVKAAGKVEMSYSGNEVSYKINSTVEDGIAVFDEQSYLLGTLSMDAFVTNDSTSLNVNNKMLDLELRSNADPANITAALQRHIDRYLTTNQDMDTLQPVVMKIKGNIRPAPILRDVILPQLQSLDTINIAVDFNEKERKLDSDIKVDYIKYADSEIDSLVISSQSDAQNLQFQLGFKNIAAGPINIKRTALTGIVAENKLNLDFTSYDDDERLIHFASTLSRKRDIDGIDNLIFNLSIDDLILNKQPWTIPDSNEIAVGEQRLLFSNFKLSNDNQSIELRSDRPNTDKEHIALLLKNFKLQGLLSYLNSDEKLATGTVNGEFILNDIYGATGILADLQINDLHAMEVPLGQLNLNAKSLNGSRYDMNLAVKGDDVDFDLSGDYQATDTTANLNLDLNISKVNMSTITGLSDDFFKDGSGSINGNFKVTGTTIDPNYNGSLRFDNASVNVTMLDTKFTLKDERIAVDNAGITLKKLRIADAQGDIFTVDGNIGTENLLVPTFNLKLKAKDFTALNSSEEDNDLYYGQATFDASAAITGNLTVPVINLDLTVKDVTDVTYVVPATELDVVQRDGIVQFVNRQNPDAILTQTEEESATLTGFDITANFKIRDDAKLKIIIDPSTGDNLQVAGSGDLKYRMTPNGRMTLTGRYEIDSGYYQLNLYEIVSRRFDLAKGGSVTWSGDPFDANLDVSAIYKVETSASALMASQTSGADLSTKNSFRQQLPFLVYLNVDGELMQPEISFKIDLPNDEQGAVGGQVYGRLQQLNSQDQELNKQVFSLLVLNRFFPTSGADGSNGGTATIARDNLNQALSDQLNQYGGKLLGKTGIDFSFGVDSYTDYQGTSSQERTQLDVTASKKLLNDRLVVSVGSEVDIQGSAQDGEETPVIGNVSIEYLLSQTGQWRLKGFRRNQYDNVIDGQLIVSGISLIFTKEFNEFKNLFAKTVLEENQKARKEEEEEQQEDIKSSESNNK
ncbi:MAG: translocation/assembly module TamB domain-containing protein [Nonlabens ulvanivorans]|uniref:translocation/assembly module TamB domain-containing protein n=2 Tax=Nonlabens ulvanivorans TaxID=906888 RepID=UPI00326698A3